MMISATCKKIFSPIQIPEKGIFGGKKWEYFFFFFFFFFFAQLRVPIFLGLNCVILILKNR